MHKSILLSSVLVVFGLASCKKGDDKKPEDSEKKTATEVKKTEASDKKVPTEPAPEKAPEEKAADTEIKASAEMAPKSDSKVAGTVAFKMVGDKVWVEAKLSGLTPGEHGFHVHEKGDCSSADGKSAGGHFNPGSTDHGGPDADMHHAGDLGNIVANAEGVAELKVELPTSFLSLAPKADNNIVGRAVIVHGGTDDLKSQPSGAAGPRLGCGVVTSL